MLTIGLLPRALCEVRHYVCTLEEQSWWPHQMKTFSTLLALCEGNPPESFTKTSDAEPWCFLWSAPEETAKQTIEIPVILAKLEACTRNELVHWVFFLHNLVCIVYALNPIVKYCSRRVRRIVVRTVPVVNTWDCKSERNFTITFPHAFLWIKTFD